MEHFFWNEFSIKSAHFIVFLEIILKLEKLIAILFKTVQFCIMIKFPIGLQRIESKCSAKNSGFSTSKSLERLISHQVHKYVPWKTD